MPGASPSGGPKGRKRCSPQGVPSPNGPSNNVPSSGLALLTHLPPQGEGSRTEGKPSPQGARSRGMFSLLLRRREARDAGGIPERWPEGPEEVFHAGRLFPRSGHRTTSPLSLLLRRRWPEGPKEVFRAGRLFPRSGHRTTSPLSLLLRRRWPEGPEEVFRAGRSFPERAIEQCPLIRPRFAHPPSP